MHATVIDTLRYADRLKDAGLEPRQAEAMSRALNDELTEGLVTKPDLDEAVLLLKGDIDDRFSQLKGDIDDRFSQLKGDLDDRTSQLSIGLANLGARVDTLENTVAVGFKAVDDRFTAMDGKFEAKFEAMDSKFEAMDSKFEAKFEAMDSKFEDVDTKFRHVFLVLTLLVGLGFYNATAPHILGALGGDSQPAASASSPAQASTIDADVGFGASAAEGRVAELDGVGH